MLAPLAAGWPSGRAHPSSDTHPDGTTARRARGRRSGGRGDGARALILASTFTSLPDAAASHMPWLLPHWNMTMRMDSLAKIRKYKGPVLISHGDADEIIPFAEGQKLFEAAPGPKRFFREPGGKHNDGRSEAYRVAFEDFLTLVDSLPLSGASRPPAVTP